jgi:hypothetical protein
MPGIPRSRAAAILQEFRDRSVDFIVVGGVAAALAGVDVNISFTLEVVHFREPDDIGRLLAALDSLEAVYRMQPELALKPGLSHLASPGHQLLTTRFGPLDILGTIGRSRAYGDLLPHTHTNSKWPRDCAYAS